MTQSIVNAEGAPPSAYTLEQFERALKYLFDAPSCGCTAESLHAARVAREAAEVPVMMDGNALVRAWAGANRVAQAAAPIDRSAVLDDVRPPVALPDPPTYAAAEKSATDSAALEEPNVVAAFDALDLVTTPSPVIDPTPAPGPSHSSIPLPTMSVGAPGGKWYVVTAGKQVGIFTDWNRVRPLVIGVSRSCFTKESSRAEAKAIFEEAYNSGAVKIL